MPVDCLSAMVEENTHRISARLTYLYPAPDIKQPPITKLSFSSLVAPIGKLEGRFVEILRGGFIFADHLVGIRERARDFVRVAERFVGVPYLWGGKTTLGIDCSGLVQISLQSAGIPCLRDSDMQMASAGEPQDPGKIEAIQRGDLLFWHGHVAIAQSPDWIIHASGYHMEVVVEPLRRALERNAESHGPLLAILRPQVEQKPAAPMKAPAAHPAPGGQAALGAQAAPGGQAAPTAQAAPSVQAASNAQAAPAAQAAPGGQVAPTGQQAGPRQAPPQQAAAQAQSGAAAPQAAPAGKAQAQKESLEAAAQLVAAKIAASMAPPAPQQQPKERTAEPQHGPAEKPNPGR